VDYSNQLFRVSSLPHITAGLTSTDELYATAKEKSAEQSIKVDKYRNEYNSFVNKETKTANNKLEQLNKASEKLEEFDFVKNELYKHLGKVQISEGCKTHLLDVFNSTRFNRMGTKELKNKYVEKGIENEEMGISIYSFVKARWMEKSVERKDDGYIMGEIDVPDREIIVDIKCSWDIITFGRNIKFIDNPRSCPYYANMQGYMKLWKKDLSKVVYVLTDTPEKLIEQEKKNLMYNFFGSQEMYEQACSELESELRFADIDPKQKVIEVPIKRDEEFIKLIQPTVIACREYLNSLKEVYYEMD
jgi:hypothetical protein